MSAVPAHAPRPQRPVAPARPAPAPARAPGGRARPAPARTPAAPASRPRLEVVRAPTLHGAETLFKPRGEPVDFGMIRPGLRADLVLVEENPLQNFKVLYGTGHLRVNMRNEVERVGGVKYTIKDGIVYDARRLLADVERMVEEQKSERRVVEEE